MSVPWSLRLRITWAAEERLVQVDGRVPLARMLPYVVRQESEIHAMEGEGPVRVQWAIRWQGQCRRGETMVQAPEGPLIDVPDWYLDL